jgi:bifunctional DNase/RNase
MTHDLLKSVFGELGATISHIVINDIQDSTFFARIVVEQKRIFVTCVHCPVVKADIYYLEC